MAFRGEPPPTWIRSKRAKRKRKQPWNLAAFQTSVKLRDYGLECFPHIVGNDALSREIRVHSVGLVEPRNPCHAAQQKRQQWNFFLLRDLRINRAEASRVGHSIVWRRFHLDQRDLRLRLLRSDRGDQAFEIGARGLGSESAQGIVGT